VQKIPTCLVRDPETRLKYVLPEMTPGCEWVFAGEGVPTRKYDGACCAIRNGLLYKRRELRKGDKPQAGFEQINYDEITGKTVGWVPVGDGPEDRWFREGLANYQKANVEVGGETVELELGPPPDGTYELVGPKVQGNPERYNEHMLVKHGSMVLKNVPIDVEHLMVFVASMSFEGIVFHHKLDGRMAKLKRRDINVNSLTKPAEA
jgi:hypothetical protein